MAKWPHGTRAGQLGRDNPTGRLGGNPTGRLGDNPTGRLGDNPTGRLGDNPTGRLACDNLTRRLGDNPTGRLGDNPAGRLGALFPYWCSSGAIRPFSQWTQFTYGQDGVVVLLGVPAARPVSVDTHANANGGLLGRPLT
jgi:hypothetical protein